MLRLENVTKTFGKQKALKDITTTFKDHETTVLVGPSGSGKSTLLRSLNLLERPESGLYDCDGIQLDFAKKITKKETLAVRQKTEMVFQDYNLFPHLTVLKNIMEGPVHVLKEDKKTAEKRALALLEKVGLKDKALAYPSQLSGGQAQRVAIARSLAMRPRYILLDEPTSALDPELELEVLKVLLELAKEKQSLIIVTHNLEFARHVADKILFIEAGKIFFEGKKDDFFNSDNQRIKDFINAMTLDAL
ncbi:amino acid ABC transporter ATP-binding protein [Ligilactobacillus faecis]|uniref:amino acid ABC transporter ATP-binding protein n=1 Tax=Ligilactobacillus faecis TaxID=762833 RepID=UPI002468CEF2|nr:amino acid ABC transporter ATP-binding protein [Ligilactobacillus faecis]WGN90051.1 amino acid ABC transporter ATP-binding protein [Ligilactobacillus faecis]